MRSNGFLRPKRTSVIRGKIHTVRPGPSLIIGVEVNRDSARVLVPFLMINNGRTAVTRSIGEPDLLTGGEADFKVRGRVLTAAKKLPKLRIVLLRVNVGQSPLAVAVLTLRRRHAADAVEPCH